MLSINEIVKESNNGATSPMRELTKLRSSCNPFRGGS